MKPAEILSILSIASVTLTASTSGQLRYRSDPGTYTDELKRLVADHRSELIAWLIGRGASESLSEGSIGCQCVCGSTELVGVSIHAGRSVRLDCAKCGRFVEFPVWYGNSS